MPGFATATMSMVILNKVGSGPGSAAGSVGDPPAAVVMLTPSRGGRGQAVDMFALVKPAKGCASCKKAF